MSPKSRQPKGAKGGKKGRKGKKGQEAVSSTTYEEVVVEEAGVPFSVVVLIALAMTLPSLMGFFDGTLEFRPAIVRFLAALLVSWLLCTLVHSVVRSFGAVQEETTTVHTDIRDPGMRDPGDPRYGDDPYGSDRQAS